MKSEVRSPKSEENRKLISSFVPERSVDYCLELLIRYDFRFVLKKERQTKLGDFRRDRNNNFTITVNRNLNPYQFLLTFIHEFAHLVVAVNYPKSAKAHGSEWKQQFKELMLPVLTPDIFPDHLLRPLARHMKNPKAAASSDPVLWKALQEFNNNKLEFTLADIAENEAFEFKGRVFRKLKKRRTRVLCQELKNGKQYLIPEIAEVKRVDN